MSTRQTRRDFLKVSGSGLLAVAGTAALAERVPGQKGARGASPGGPLSVWVTDDGRRCAPALAVKWEPASRPATREAVVLDAGKKFQKILGFGAAFTDSACYMFNQLSGAPREELFHQLFHPAEMSLSVCRT